MADNISFWLIVAVSLVLLDVFGGFKGIHGLDKPDGADGDHVLDARRRCLKLFGNVHDQPQVVGDEQVTGLGAAAA